MRSRTINRAFLILHAMVEKKEPGYIAGYFTSSFGRKREVTGAYYAGLSPSEQAVYRVGFYRGYDDKESGRDSNRGNAKDKR
jgi:hypothetical protein